MVKINKTLGLALLTALAASCSSDNDVAGTNNPTIENGEANYATLKIDLPTRAGVRAVDFNDGLASEYTVNDATLLLFKKGTTNDEKDFTFVESVPLGNMNPWQKSSATGITTTANVTAELKKAPIKDLKDGNIYGLVILNNVTKDGKGTKITIPAEGTKYSEWNVPGSVTTDANNVANMLDNSKGFVMANAPEWKKTGDAPTTLVQIDGNKVKPTEALAKAAGAAADIHVERGLAKVTIAQYGENNTIPVDENSTYKDCTVKLDAWALDVTNKTSFPIHKTDGLDSEKNYTEIWKSDGKASSSSTVPSVNRFVDGANTEFKRVYWGIDPNYNLGADYITGADAKKKLAEKFNMLASNADITGSLGENNPQYCLENTFDIDNMTQGQTTRVLIKATISVPTTKAKSDDDEEGYLDADDPYTPGDNLYKIDKVAGLYTAYQLSGIIADYVYDHMNNKIVTVSLDGTDIADKAGVHQLQLTKANFLTASSGAKVRTRAIKPPVTTNSVVPDDNEIIELNKVFKITTYKDGVCYYIGRIKHFGDDETPWEQGNDTYGKPGNNLKWLGRYGVLRNNWYSLSVGSVSAPGDPTIPQVVPENPDDDNFNYINLTVNILKWAKRTNGDGFDL